MKSRLWDWATEVMGATDHDFSQLDECVAYKHTYKARLSQHVNKLTHLVKVEHLTSQGYSDSKLA